MLRFSCLVTVQGIFCSIYSSNSDYSQPVLQSETSYKRGPGIRPVWPADCHQSQRSYRTFLVWLNMMSFFVFNMSTFSLCWVSFTPAQTQYVKGVVRHLFWQLRGGFVTDSAWQKKGRRVNRFLFFFFIFFFKGESVTGELCVKSCSLTFLILEELIVGLNPGQIVGAVGLFIRLDGTIKDRRSF